MTGVGRLRCVTLFQRHQDLCQRLLGRHPPRPRAADEHIEEAAATDGHHRVRGQ